jgi:hypothetical protein
MARRLSKKKIKEALMMCKGNISDVARSLECDRKTVYNYINRHPDVKKAHLDAKDAAIDYVEGKLFTQIGKGNVTAMIFYLKTQAKERGYVERQEITGKDSGPLIIEYVNDWRNPEKD